MSVSMLAWMAQLDDVSLRAVTRIEYRCATVTVGRSIGNSSTSVFTEKACQQVSIYEKHKEILTPSTSMIRISWPSIQKKNAAKALVLMMRRR